MLTLDFYPLGIYNNTYTNTQGEVMFTPHFYIESFQNTKKIITDQIFKDPAQTKQLTHISMHRHNSPRWQLTTPSTWLNILWKQLVSICFQRRKEPPKGSQTYTHKEKNYVNYKWTTRSETTRS